MIDRSNANVVALEAQSVVERVGVRDGCAWRAGMRWRRSR
jgi:hypothetical protein